MVSPENGFFESFSRIHLSSPNGCAHRKSCCIDGEKLLVYKDTTSFGDEGYGGFLIGEENDDKFFPSPSRKEIIRAKGLFDCLTG